jgi:hypothetical protein
VLEIHFLDHCEDGDKALAFVVWGRVDRVYKKSLRVVSWAHENPRQAKHSECGTEKTFTIVRSAITQIYQLRREDLRLSS